MVEKKIHRWRKIPVRQNLPTHLVPSLPPSLPIQNTQTSTISIALYCPITTSQLFLSLRLLTPLLILLDSSGIDPSVTSSFPGSTVTTGPATSGRQIPPEQGGDTIIDSGRTKASHPSDGPGQSGSRSEQRMTKDSDFEGEGGPEDKIAQIERDQGGDDQVRGNIR